MRRSKLLIVALSVTLILCFSQTALAMDYPYFIESVLTIGSTEAWVGHDNTTVDVAPYIKNGRTLVPLRFMEKCLKATVSWDPALRQAAVETGTGLEVKVTIGQSVAEVNGEKITLDVPAEIKGGRTFVPLRFISENLGAVVEYQPLYQNISITYIDKSDWKQFKESTYGIILKYPGDWNVLKENATQLTLESPNGSIIEFNTESKDFDTVISEKVETYNQNKWLVSTNESLGDEVWSVGANWFGDPIEEKIYECYIFQIVDKVYSFDWTGENWVDQIIFPSILSDMTVE